MEPRHLVATSVAAVVLGASTSAAAETIYGTLSGAAGANARLVITCEKAAAHAIADKAGSYHLTVNGRGRCRLQVDNMPAPGELVFVYEEPTRYDYEVILVDGVARIERR